MFKNMGIKGRLFSIFMFVSFLNVVVGTVNYVQFQKVTSTYNHVTTVNMKKSEAIANMRIFFRGVRIEVRTLGLAGLTAEEEKQAVERIHHEIQNYESWNKKYAEVPFAPGEEEIYRKVDDVWKEFKALGMRVVDLSKTRKPEDVKKMLDIFMTDCPELAKKYAVVNMELVEFQNKESETWSQHALDSVRSTNFITVALVLASFFAAVLLGFWLATGLAGALNKLADKLSDGAGEVTSAANQISTSSDALAGTTNQQASALQETAASVQEMSAMVNKNAENASRSREFAAENQTAAEGGKNIVDEMISAIGDISESNDQIMRQTEASNQKIAEIVNVINEIGNKTKVINDIVFQTKLLSFNASVEAARAGEHGKGFAVVAEEVGNLAQMSGNAAQEIKTMLEASIQRVNAIVSETQSQISSQVSVGREKVARGTEIAKRCGEVLEKIVINVSGANAMASEIATASSEQANGVHEITNAISQLEQVTQQNTSISQQAANASMELTAQADSMREIVHELLTTIRGANGATDFQSSESTGSNVRQMRPGQGKSARKRSAA